MASFILGVLCGMLIEEVARYGVRKCDKWKEQLEALPDINQEVEELDRDKTKVLKAENN
tara:strand:+ start:76 stop:252 length:177 start_codon:yes stop_codon:yes gene_type:complete